MRKQTGPATSPRTDHRRRRETAERNGGEKRRRETAQRNGAEKATEGGAMRQCPPFEQRHERGGKRREAFEIGLQGAFAADRVAKHEHEKVQGLVLAESSAHEAHLG